mgnify:FL=1
MIDLTKLTEDLVRQHNLATEKLTENQLADVIRQAIEAEDFNTLVLPDGTQKVIYVPFLRYKELKARIFALEEQLRKTAQVSDGPKLAGAAGSAEKAHRIVEDGRRHETPHSKARGALWCYLLNEFEVVAFESELDEIVALSVAIRDAEMALPPNAHCEPRRTDP